MFLGMPLALGSWWGLPVLALVMPAFIWRIIDEERLLTQKLPGYAEYKDKVPWRLIPFVWSGRRYSPFVQIRSAPLRREWRV